MATEYKKALLIIDSHALIHRAYHALPKDMSSPQGQPTNAVYGFASVLIKVLRELKPGYVMAAFDLAGPTFRHEAYEDYKAKRAKTEENLEKQFSIVRRLLEAFGIPILEHSGFEADDIIGTIVEQLQENRDLKIVIVTGDLDTLQLVKDDQVVVYTLRRGVTDTIIYTQKEVEERFGGLRPNQLTDFKGLKGDPSDNIPGVPGVGEKTAIDLLQKYPSIEEVYKNFEQDQDVKEGIKKKLRDNFDQALFSRELASIRRDAPVGVSLEESRFDFYVTSKLLSFLQELGFKSLINRLDKEENFQQVLTKEENMNSDPFKQYLQKGIFSKRIYEIETALAPILKKMESTGILIDRSAVKKLNDIVTKELSGIEEDVAQQAGELFNLNSPQEVGRILFEKLSLGGIRIKKTPTGNYSTRAADLEKLKKEHPIVELILRWRELAKLKSTYLDALPKLINPKDGRIHTTFKQLGAATGRLSSENPNLQNIPIKGEFGKDIRKVFIARSGFVLLAADYTQIELRVAAALSKDSKMIETFLSGQDIHARTAAEVFNTTQDKVTKGMRRQAKILNFGVLYGMGPRAFSQAAEIPYEQAQKFITEYKSDFAELTKYLEDLKSKAYAQGYTQTLWGRRRYLPELSSPNPGMRAAGERMAINMPIQGTATADIVKAAMVEIDKQVGDKEDIFMILQIHDELVFEVKEDKVRQYASLIKESMENVINLEVPITVKIEMGTNWGELKLI